METISFIIPCYNSAQTVGNVINQIQAAMSLRENEYDYEIIAVNDHSPDQVMLVLEKLAHENNSIKVLDLMHNRGKHSALMAGCRYAQGDYITFLDDDGQCPMENFWDLFAPMKEDYDLSVAAYGKKKQSFFKNILSRLNNKMMDLLIEKPKHIQFSNFMVLTKAVKEALIAYEGPFPYISGTLLRITENIKNVPMEEHPRTSGKTNYTFIKSLRLFLNGATGFSTRPFQFLLYSGFLLSFLGISLILVIAIGTILGFDLPILLGSILGALLLSTGFIMIGLGMIGELAGRLLMTLNKMPQFTLHRTINIETEDAHD